MRFILLLVFVYLSETAGAQTLSYPQPVRYFSLSVEGRPVKMAFMDVRPVSPNNEVFLLFHGKNFNGYYWKQTIEFLTGKGYRVIVPDQLGWGKSDKPGIHYSFHMLANNTKLLLDSLKIPQVHMIGHSMGGMLATRFALMFPKMVLKLVLENPIGLEDYRTFIPYQTIDTIYRKELKTDLASLKKYQQTYYPQWKPEYDQYVTAQYQALQWPSFKEALWASALTYQMIYEQPVVYEFKNLELPVLLVVGQEDRTVLGKDLLPKGEVHPYGNYPELGKWLKQQITGSVLKPLQGVGHVPHIQVSDEFHNLVLDFIRDK